MSDITISSHLVTKLKRSLGDMSLDNEMNDYYMEKLMLAKSDLITDDISFDVLESELGQQLVVLYAKALVNETDIATNPTISLLRNKLSLMTKGDRVDVQQ